MSITAKGAIALSITLALIVAGYAFRPKDTARETTTLDPASSANNAPVAAIAEAPAATTGTVDVSADNRFHFDLDRLYDISYLNDPDLAAYAELENVTPECIVARLKKRLDGELIAENVCSTLDAVHFLNPNNEDYAALSNDELAAVALVDAEAAVVMGRRLNDHELSERWFEQAAVLSGKAGPLLEWVVNHDNGLSRDEYEALLYEIYLTNAALGFAVEAPAIAAEGLIERGTDLGPIQERARQRYERLTEMRRAYAGKSWGES